ncbi:MAG TPA: radical SAM family heme chaperone HemW [Bacillota bacterium]|nr:radical SAM family heme chaperone HemW [Bacillota bacterium]
MKAREIMDRGLYIHLPFCRSKCHYCDFPSYAGREELMGPYLQALLGHIDSYKTHGEKYRISTIYLGGGTPTLFNGQQLAKVLERCMETFLLNDDAEITVECNPESVDQNKLGLLRDSGYNRLSIGLQAWQDQHLELLGRGHTRQHFLDSVKWAKEAGFENISADVIFGIPNQTLDQWLATLEGAVSSGVSHLSAYSLIIEEGTRLAKLKSRGDIIEMDDSDERRLYHRGIEMLDQLGLSQYEISNFSKIGCESKHNLNYWKNGEYLGIGSAAHSYLKGVRRANTHDIKTYIDNVGEGSVLVYTEEIDQDQEVFETLMLGFRLNEGIYKEEFFNRFGFPIEKGYSAQLESLEAQGLIRVDDKAIRPTALGMDFQNTIALTFLDQ